MLSEDVIDYAKEVLESVFSSIKFKDSYQNSYQDVLDELVKSTKLEILRSYKSKNNHIYGVFGKDGYYDSRDKSERGDKLIARVAESICKEFKNVVVTGRKIYYPFHNKVKSKTVLIDNLVKRLKDRDEWRTAFSKVLGDLPDIGIFLMDMERAASLHEEAAFHTKTRIKGLAVAISHKKIEPCKHFFTGSVESVEYGKCNSKEYSLCEKKNSKCMLYKIKINKTSVEPFIRKRYGILIVEKIFKLEKIIIHELK